MDPKGRGVKMEDIVKNIIKISIYIFFQPINFENNGGGGGGLRFWGFPPPPKKKWNPLIL